MTANVSNDQIVSAIEKVNDLIKKDNSLIIERISSLEDEIKLYSSKQADMTTTVTLLQRDVEENHKSIDQNWNKTRKHDEQISELKETFQAKLTKQKEDSDKLIVGIEKKNTQAISDMDKKYIRIITILSVVSGLITAGIININ